MKDQRQPTTLTELEKLVEGFSMETDQDVYFDNNGQAMVQAAAWLQWTYNFLSARKQYHKKRQLEQAMLVKMAKTLLSPDELEQIEREAEGQLVDDSVKCCPECEKPNQFGELCESCRREMEDESKALDQAEDLR